MRARVLAYVLIDGHIVGVAALKVPVQSYRDSISRKSGFSIADWKYPLELGYLVVDKSARGQKLSTRLVDAVLDAAGDSGLFATTSSTAVHKILPRVGFVVRGNTYKSNDGDELTLYVRDNLSEC
jgi:predicted GNAT family N-acyltransferase